MSGMRKKLVFKFAKGFRGRAKNCHRIARNRVEKALQHAYRGRKLKKRDNRQIWIGQVNAGSLQYGVPYSGFIHGLKKNNIGLNRKMLAELAENEPLSFQSLVVHVKPNVTQSKMPKVFEDVGYVGMRLGNKPENMSVELEKILFQK
mmetsp:Transcript_4016/g.9461  ORF Transcript_4016/g.9461 Transcript_4016/m.9461 type:complete len:147 (-) Transcript_4016:104-544(-)|eukprot:CAMPEP_0114499872 /NCGR_PEP_ID=MMETSP0109-20121206/7654_1 /TAXON_ID=29199 /ORGANISM="Chlorarachnion reptans, Strain CCCM449" /LENGTH=146 /DNA_ID=CAMNT_0001677479 /DNA_START=73 /DNA_END=513 /DNA_ORIENTATION=-